MSPQPKTQPEILLDILRHYNRPLNRKEILDAMIARGHLAGYSVAQGKNAVSQILSKLKATGQVTTDGEDVETGGMLWTLPDLVKPADPPATEPETPKPSPSPAAEPAIDPDDIEIIQKYRTRDGAEHDTLEAARAHMMELYLDDEIDLFIGETGLEETRQQAKAHIKQWIRWSANHA
jgi:hypothetical protein